MAEVMAYARFESRQSHRLLIKEFTRQAWRGTARHGKARHGRQGGVRRDMVGFGLVQQGKAGMARVGKVRLDVERSGKAGMARFGEAGRSKARQA